MKPEFERLVRNGNELHPDQVVVEQMFPGFDASAQAAPCREEGEGQETFRVCGTDGTFYGLYAFWPEGRTGKYRPVKMFLT